MYIQPNSTIQIMRGVPLTTGYRDTIYFGQISAQESWFTAKVVYTFNSQSYQRVNKNTCRVEINAESIYNCNYMRFKNTAFGSKWFYAFITSVEYINNNVSEITYEIDILQTWHFDYVLGKCFVEREHTTTDQIGDHLLPEPIDTGEPYCQAMTSAGLNELYIVLVYAPDPDTPVSSLVREGSYTACLVECQPLTQTGVNAIDAKINTILGYASGADSIVGIYLAPKKFALYVASDEPHTETIVLGRPSTIAGFIPNNKKLLTYPYSFLSVDSLNDSHIYRYEYFQGETVAFEATGCVLGTPSVICAPVDYEMNQITNYTQQIVMGGYPMCAFTVDSYKQWLASSGVFNTMSAISSAGAIAASAATGSVMGMGVAALGVASAIAHDRVESQRANTSRGSVSTFVNAQMGTKDIYFKQMGLKLEKAKSLDDFFSRYGYSCEQVKVPNRAVRKRWTYTKTKGCVVKGNVPADDLERIASIFDKGVTFWTTIGDVGEYVMNDNAPGLG